MKFATLALITVSASALATAGLAQEHRELGAHEHGVGQLNIAVEDDGIAMELHAPGADIVGFEHPAESDEDKALITAAIAALEQPLSLFVLPEAAGCTVVEAHAGLELEEHDDHEDHDEHAEDHDDHEEHTEEHDDHDHDEHAEEHDDHDHDEHAEDEHAEEDHDHEEHAKDDHDDHDHEEGGHSEFHAEYALTCSDIGAVDSIVFDYFTAFPNAQELDIQLVTDHGATAAEVERDNPELALEGHN